MIPDQSLRQSALDTKRSFIVQAPAGSGKTELLVQRFLALLGQAERQPEEIIAITFTRKAAAEMRLRILSALQAAQGPAPSKPHAYQTWQLGCAALQRDKEAGWHLLENTGRLRVLTIDALCTAITHQAPLLSGLGIANTLLGNEVKAYYLEASRRLLANLEEKSPLATQLSQLFLHLDNRVELIENLFVRMLARRDQWLPHLISHGACLSSEAFRQHLQAGLQHIVIEILQQCQRNIPVQHHEELLALLQFAQHNLVADNLELAIGASDLLQLPPPILEKKPVWLFLTHTLLTQEGAWRIKVDKRQGFPATDKAMKQRMHSLLEQFHQGHEALRHSLTRLLHAPPSTYSQEQWRIIAALADLLPLLVAELNVLLKQKGVADFNEVAQAANVALGDKEMPTDLTLLLDSQIRHLLIDEFQDTSMTQFRLLEKLTMGWQPDDGRSLFLVGDPMQSIYRFREAEVGLFLKAQQEGLGSLHLHPLVLQANFRSTPELINWSNAQFSAIFPPHSDISTGAVVFAPSIATRPTDKSSGVFLASFPPEHTPLAVEEVITIVTQQQTNNPQQTTAILVRSRPHLTPIVAALKKANINFTAVEIDALYQQSIIQDLLALTGALLHIGDRLNWLAVLRAPWCGLTLTDLHALAVPHANKPIWEILQECAGLTTLTHDGLGRLNMVIPVLQHSLEQRGRLPLRCWVEKTWLALQGPACITDSTELDSAAAYFKLLDGFDQTGEIPDISVLHQILQTQYATPLAKTDNRLQVMTIHKAKGLEFDTVIVPQLQLTNKNADDQLLLWLDRPRAGYANDLILAPIKAQNKSHDAIYRWLSGVEKIKSQHELARLLYVAATRAKRNLHLVTILPAQDSCHAFKAPDKRSFLDLLWPYVEPIAQQHASMPMTHPALNLAPSPAPRMLRRLRLGQHQPTLQDYRIIKEPVPSHLQLNWQPIDSTASQVGTVIHLILEQISREGLAVWQPQRLEQEATHWQLLLTQAGVAPMMLATSLMNVRQTITHTLNDSRGRWILTHHTEQHSEYALTAILNGSLKRCVIDRTFVDEQQIRWIIDYKTHAVSEEQDTQRCLAQAQTLYGAQLEEYAHIVRMQDARAIRLGIYFPLFGGWVDWGFRPY